MKGLQKNLIRMQNQASMWKLMLPHGRGTLRETEIRLWCCTLKGTVCEEQNSQEGSLDFCDFL